MSAEVKSRTVCYIHLRFFLRPVYALVFCDRAAKGRE